MDGLVLSAWTTLLGDASYVTLITQPEKVPSGPGGWLDLPDYDDVALFLEVREVTGTVLMAYQTSPSAEDASFASLFTAFQISASTTPRVDRVYAAFAGLPLARFLRWQISTSQVSGPWSTTFRVSIAAYGPRA